MHLYFLSRYERLTPIEYMKQPLGSLENVMAGDCIVCFSKSNIYSLCQELEKLGKECAVIYGSLPPGESDLHRLVGLNKIRRYLFWFHESGQMGSCMLLFHLMLYCNILNLCILDIKEINGWQWSNLVWLYIFIGYFICRCETCPGCEI